MKVDPHLAYPLQWPAGKARTPPHRIRRSQFDRGIAFGRTRQLLVVEVMRLGGAHIVISTNVETKGDGMPYANRNAPRDAGVCLYFMLGGKQQAMPCDAYDRVQDNLRALTHIIAAMRTIERHGGDTMLNAAFIGFNALPLAPVKRSWWEVLDLPRGIGAERAKMTYRQLVFDHHPDRGGDVEKFKEITEAYRAFEQERGL